MGEEALALRQRDRDRLREIRAAIQGDITGREAAQRLQLSVRQVKRLVRKVRTIGDAGIVHGLRSRPSNRRCPESQQRQAVRLLSRPEYHDFGPTLAAEHLSRSGIEVSRETVRRWMREAGLWQSKRQKITEVHTWRERRSCFGELVLMDTSDHLWLEDRGPRLRLIAMIDDATSRVWARFALDDTTAENLVTLRGWLQRFGRPLALYTDKNSIFVTTRSEVRQRIEGRAATCFEEALQELRIEWIAAHSPQAKGRVERLFGTLQDRLLKELRIARIKDLAQANVYLEQVFLPMWEQRFTTPPRRSQDAHRGLGTTNLDSVLCLRNHRTVASDYTLSYRGRLWAIARQHVVPGLRKARILVEERLDGTVWCRYRQHRIPLRALPLPAPLPARIVRRRSPQAAGTRTITANRRETTPTST
jgi:transposase